MKITQTRLKEIIQEELAAVQEAAGDGSGTGVSKATRDEQKRKAAIACNSKEGKQWDPKELTGPGLFSKKLERACKDKVKENVNSIEPRYVKMDEVDEILKAKFKSDVWGLRSRGESRPEEVAADQLLNYVTNHINRLATEHLRGGELEEGMFGLTTTSSSDQKLSDQRDMWLSRIHSLYIALRDSVGPQQADMVLDSIGMSPADLRPSEPSRLEEGELAERSASAQERCKEKGGFWDLRKGFCYKDADRTKAFNESELEESWGEPLRKPDLNKPLRKPDLKTKSGAGGSGKDRPQHQATHTTRRRGFEE